MEKDAFRRSLCTVVYVTCHVRGCCNLHLTSPILGTSMLYVPTQYQGVPSTAGLHVGICNLFYPSWYFSVPYNPMPAYPTHSQMNSIQASKIRRGVWHPTILPNSRGNCCLPTLFTLLFKFKTQMFSLIWNSFEKISNMQNSLDAT